MPGNHYMVLGIDHGADLPQIKRAYRRAIKRYHPDRGGSANDAGRFREAREAYEVLSDADRRRAYDAELRREGIPVEITHLRDAVRRRRNPWPPAGRSASPLAAFFEDREAAFRRNRTRPGIPRDLYMEVVLTPEEARRGGVFPVAVPVAAPCPDCAHGAWREWSYCPTCGGEGTLQARRAFSLAIPPAVVDGTSSAVSLDDIGLRGVRLYIDVRVQAHP